MLLRQATLVPALTIFVASCSAGGYVAENNDVENKARIAKNGQEAREWIRKCPGNTVGTIQPNSNSVAYIDGIYAMGAPHVFAIDVDKDPRGEYTKVLIVELPQDSAARKRILAWEADIAHSQGFDAYSDVGQQYVFVMLD